MRLDDAFYHGQTDARTAVLAACMQSLEHFEDALSVLRIDTDSIVADAEFPLRPFPCREDAYARRFAAAVLERIADQVLQQQNDLRAIAVNRRQRAGFDLRRALLYSEFQICDRVVVRRLRVDVSKTERSAPNFE